MQTDLPMTLSTDFSILTGQSGSGSGVGYVPLKNGIYEFLIGNIWNPTAGTNYSVTNLGAFSAVNNYIASPFILAESINVNRFIIRTNAVSSFVGTVRGGVMSFDSSTGFPTQVSSAITFVTNAFEDKTSGFTAGAFTEFVFSTTVTLSANTWYCFGAQVIARTSGSITFNSHPQATWGQSIRFPNIKCRTGANNQFNNIGSAGFGLGFYNGVSTSIYVGDPCDGSSNAIQLYPTSTTNTQVGCKFEINLPVDEIYIKSILLFQHQINTNHSIQCKIYGDLAGSKLIGSSVIIASSNLVTVAAGTRQRNYYFAPPLRIKPYKSYYAMWEVTSGAPTAVAPTLIQNMSFDQTQYDPFDTTNRVFYRANSTDANFTESANLSAPVTFIFDTVRRTPRPQIGNL